MSSRSLSVNQGNKSMSSRSLSVNPRTFLTSVKTRKNNCDVFWKMPRSDGWSCLLFY